MEAKSEEDKGGFNKNKPQKNAKNRGDCNRIRTVFKNRYVCVSEAVL